MISGRNSQGRPSGVRRGHGRRGCFTGLRQSEDDRVPGTEQGRGRAVGDAVRGTMGPFGSPVGHIKVLGLYCT